MIDEGKPITFDAEEADTVAACISGTASTAQDNGTDLKLIVSGRTAKSSSTDSKADSATLREAYPDIPDLGFIKDFNVSIESALNAINSSKSAYVNRTGQYAYCLHQASQALKDTEETTEEQLSSATANFADFLQTNQTRDIKDTTKHIVEKTTDAVADILDLGITLD